MTYIDGEDDILMPDDVIRPIGVLHLEWRLRNYVFIKFFRGSRFVFLEHSLANHSFYWLLLSSNFVCFQDHEDTLKLVEDYKFASVFINQFFPRPGTPAARMPQVPAQEVSIITHGNLSSKDWN